MRVPFCRIERDIYILYRVAAMGYAWVGFHPGLTFAIRYNIRDSKFLELDCVIERESSS